MQYLFVQVVKARDLPSKDATESLDPYVEVRVGNYMGRTKYSEQKHNHEWNEEFAFSPDEMQATSLEIMVKYKDLVMDDFVGIVRMDLNNDIPTRDPPDSPLAPEWYQLEDKSGERKRGELMLTVWFGTQADEAFSDAWHSNAMDSDEEITPDSSDSRHSDAMDSDEEITSDSSLVMFPHTGSWIFFEPKLWYVRVNVIEARDLVPSDRNRFLDVCVKVQIGNQIFRTKTVQVQTMNPIWNEDMLFVAAEPFEDHLILSVEDLVGPNEEESIRKVVIPLNQAIRRVDDTPVHGRWVDLERTVSATQEDEQLHQSKTESKFHGRLHLILCLEGGFHVLTESMHNSSDLQPTAAPTRKPPIGVLELAFLKVKMLHPMKTRDEKGTSDAYCVAKYGKKWVRTRTIIDSMNPRYNEQYTWEVYDLATDIIVGVFDNGEIGGSNGSKDTKIGKVRIRMSTLEAGRVYCHSCALLVLQSTGVKKMGEIDLALRFSCWSIVNMMLQYSRPLFPKMHYVRPLTEMQQDMLRYHAVNIMTAWFSQAEPPLRKEVVEHMIDTNSHLFSMRQSEANFSQPMSAFSGFFTFGKWLNEIYMWMNPILTISVLVLFSMPVFLLELIFPTIFLYMFLIGLWNYRYRPQYPLYVNAEVSYTDGVTPHELDEEFDTFPTNWGSDDNRRSYDRFRALAGKVQTIVGDVATQGERIQLLLSWRDPRATAIFTTFCLIAAIVLYTTPFQVLALMSGSFLMRPPWFRSKVPSAPVNFFRRLPARTDTSL